VPGNHRRLAGEDGEVQTSAPSIHVVLHEPRERRDLGRQSPLGDGFSLGVRPLEGFVAGGLVWLVRPYGTNSMNTNKTAAMPMSQSRVFSQERPGRLVVLAMRGPLV
jgi:hypothetical protein